MMRQLTMAVVLFGALVIAASVCAQGVANPYVMKYGPYHSYPGAAQMGLTVGGSPVALTVPAGATVIEVCVETGPVRYRDDGIAPTATVGMPVSAGSCFIFSGSLSALQFIAQSGSPTIDVEYYQ